MGDLIELWPRRLRPNTVEIPRPPSTGLLPILPPDPSRDELLRVLSSLDKLFQLDCRLAAAILKVAEYQREAPIDQVALRRAVTHITLAVDLLERSI
jgi:hypothetical protein